MSLKAFPVRPREAQLERRAVALGRRLARSLGQQDDEENELELEQDLEDEPDMELSGVVGVTVLEAQKLAGVNINPYVTVHVGGQRRVTATQLGTNCPFYNEYFLFEFHDTRLRLQDLLLEITPERNPGHCPSDDSLTATLCVPPVVPDLAAPSPLDGQFYQRWAPLHDPQDTRAGAKGFVKVTLSVRARGDLPPPMLPEAPGHCSDIEK
ncbi:Fer-1-like protein 4 [Saguinus oedipus]|uniref:Fer-1-like protein 4 n=1 Tax=Saguinus oedipus TaxID=9490 RepID=A0ABQ9VKJ9_SAGOE|nr:Fer-1-like protein 4 [Saguinus oedipus]